MQELFESFESPTMNALAGYMKEARLNWALKGARGASQLIERAARRGYNMGDASAKIAKAEHHFKIINKELERLKPGEDYVLPQSIVNKIDIVKQKDGTFTSMDGKIKYGRLGDPRLDHIMARAAEREAYKLFPNYNLDVGAMIPLMRQNALTAPVSWFPTWAYKVLDAPGKKGILTGIFMDSAGYGPRNSASALLSHNISRGLRVARQIAYQNSLRGIVDDVDVFNGQVTETTPGTFSLGQNTVYDADEYDYAWVKGSRSYNPLNPSMTSMLLLMKAAGGAGNALWSSLGMKPTTEIKRLNNAFEKGFLRAGSQEALTIAGLGGNLVVELIMTASGYKQFGYRTPGPVDYYSKLSSAVVGGTGAQMLDALMASAGPESKWFYSSRYQFAEPYKTGDKRAGMSFSRMAIMRIFGGFKKVKLSKKDANFVKKFTKVMEEKVLSLKDKAKKLSSIGMKREAAIVLQEMRDAQLEIDKQKKLLMLRVSERKEKFRRGRMINVGSLNNGN